MSGLNFALCDEVMRALLRTNDAPCVFISYKSEDIAAAEAINEYLNKTAGINTYFDANDARLQKSVSISNDVDIVNSIQNGLNNTTHLLCLISDKTHLSWWVPYEIGYADNKKMAIASLKLKSIDDIPSFLKTQRVLYNIEDFLEYFSSVNRYDDLFTRYANQRLSKQGTEKLGSYIEKGE